MVNVFILLGANIQQFYEHPKNNRPFKTEQPAVFVPFLSETVSSPPPGQTPAVPFKRNGHNMCRQNQDE